jgi:membrane-bound inhibitor of C-type lysozyme
MARFAFFAVLALPGAAQAALDVTTFRYTCERGVEIPVVYVNDGDEGSVASLYVEGSLITLYVEPAASGARYGWPSDGSNYVWLTKGDGAMLLWKDSVARTETTLLAECTVAQ